MLRYAITPGSSTGFDGTEMDGMIARGGELSRAGVDFLLLRQKQLVPDRLTALARRVVAASAGSAMRVLVPGSVESALASGAHGVHLSGWQLSGQPGALEQVRRLMPQAWVSVSCHTPEEVLRVCGQGADAVLFAPVFGKIVDGVEVVRGVGLARLRVACRLAGSVPVFALGSVNEANAAACIEAGAAGVAGIRMFFGA